MNIKAGDIVQHKVMPGVNPSLRYLVLDIKGDWIHLAVARKDGKPDRRWVGFSAGTTWYEKAES